MFIQIAQKVTSYDSQNKDVQGLYFNLFVIILPFLQVNYPLAIIECRKTVSFFSSIFMLHSLIMSSVVTSHYFVSDNFHGIIDKKWLHIFD